MSRDQALKLFTMLSIRGYAVSIKHRANEFHVEVPVRLKGDPAYGQEGEISRLVMSAGYRAVQTNQMLRIG